MDEVCGHDRGRTITTGIFKEPVADLGAVRHLNLAGDRQADLTVHGGPEKALYVYPSEHYACWRAALPDAGLRWAAFGENLTNTGRSKRRSASATASASARPSAS